MKIINSVQNICQNVQKKNLTSKWKTSFRQNDLATNTLMFKKINGSLLDFIYFLIYLLILKKLRDWAGFWQYIKEMSKTWLLLTIRSYTAFQGEKYGPNEIC